MRVDVGRLKEFYASPLGEAARRMIERRIAAIWPHADRLDVLGIGYSDIYLERLQVGARRSVSAAPAGQGASPWPSSGKCATTLVDEERLPFPDALFDRVLVVHGLEESDSPSRILREIWRVCAPKARILLVAANRAGLWARAETTPFGHGRPFSRSQLDAILKDAMFQPTAWARALYAPPAQWSFITSAAETWEKTGEIGWRGFGGVLMVEAVKRLYIDPRTASAKVAPSRKTVAAGVSQPQQSREADAARRQAGDVAVPARDVELTGN